MNNATPPAHVSTEHYQSLIKFYFYFNFISHFYFYFILISLAIKMAMIIKTKKIVNSHNPQ